MSLKLCLMSLNRILPAKSIPILLYHSIDNSKREDSVSPSMFSRQMEYLHTKGYKVISLDEVADDLKKSCKKRDNKLLAITFDDGYQNIYQYAMPILQKYGFTASVFLPTKYIGKNSEWIYPSMPLLTWDEILTIEQQGIAFGSHSHSHRGLTDLTEKQAKEELEKSKKILEDKLNKPVPYIAYPFSKSNEIIEKMALGCGYKLLLSAVGVERRRMPKGHCVLLRRSVMRNDTLLSFKFILSNTYQYYFDIKSLMVFF